MVLIGTFIKMKYIFYISLILGLFYLTSSHLTTLSKGSVYLVSDTTTTAALADTWYDMNGRYADGFNIRFELTESGLIYKGQTAVFLFVGSSNAKADKVCVIYYGLFLNSETEPIDYGFNTPVNFEHANSFNNFSLTRFVELNYNDTIHVKWKSTAATTLLSTDQLSTIFLETKL